MLLLLLLLLLILLLILFYFNPPLALFYLFIKRELLERSIRSGIYMSYVYFDVKCTPPLPRSFLQRSNLSESFRIRFS